MAGLEVRDDQPVRLHLESLRGAIAQPWPDAADLRQGQPLAVDSRLIARSQVVGALDHPAIVVRLLAVVDGRRLSAD